MSLGFSVCELGLEMGEEGVLLFEKDTGSVYRGDSRSSAPLLTKSSPESWERRVWCDIGWGSSAEERAVERPFCGDGVRGVSEEW